MSDDDNRIVVGDPEMIRMFYPKPKPQPRKHITPPEKSGRFFGFNVPKFSAPSKPRTLGPVSLKPSRKNGKSETTVELNVRGLNRPFIYGFVVVMIGLSCLALLAIFGVFSPLFSLWGI